MSEFGLQKWAGGVVEEFQERLQEQLQELQARTKQTARLSTGGCECPPDVLARTPHDDQRAFLAATHKHSMSCDQRQEWFAKEKTLHPERFHDDGMYRHPSHKSDSDSISSSSSSDSDDGRPQKKRKSDSSDSDSSNSDEDCTHQPQKKQKFDGDTTPGQTN